MAALPLVASSQAMLVLLPLIAAEGRAQSDGGRLRPWRE
jgi:hypothetical protein